MKKLLLLLVFGASAMGSAQNPHDGYAFWLPCGELKVGDDKSEASFQAKRVAGALELSVQPRKTRFDVPRGQIVAVMSTKWSGNGSIKQWPKVSFNQSPAKPLLPVTFAPKTQGATAIVLTITPALAKGATVRFYWTDDSAALGSDLSTALYVPDARGVDDAFLTASIQMVEQRYLESKQEFLYLAGRVSTPNAQRLCRRMARWCDAELASARIKTGPGAYDLGLYCMLNGFWDTAESSFRKAVNLMPKNPDAWYMLGDALSYKASDLDKQMASIYPYYKKAADLYPRDGANTFRTFFGMFKQLRVKDGNTTRVLNMTNEQINHAKEAWEWCSAIMESASKGRLRMVNTYKVYDQEFDSTNDWNAKPFEGLFPKGSVETFMKMTGWGASDCCGMDCGPDRSAFVNMGIREWDVMLHEWNHSLDWAMISGELGVGVPETHSSDWCGYQPISSMGMGHHSCNRYYMTPGMYQFMRGSDPVTTPYLTNWSASQGPTELAAEVTEATNADSKKMDPFVNEARLKTASLSPIASLSFPVQPKVVDGYVDLKDTWPDSPKNGYAFAQTYLYSPKQQKVRMWVGADDNIRMWLNGKLIHKGVYWACALFTEVKEKDQVAKGVVLEQGWNKIVVQVTNVQRAPDWLGGNPPDCWGFSVRICDSLNREVSGLKSQTERPTVALATQRPAINPAKPRTYSWPAVKDDYTALLPELSAKDLAGITGYRSLKVTNDMLIDVSGETKTVSGTLAKPDADVVRLDNQVNWFFSPHENAGFIRYKRNGIARDLLFLRPEGYDPFLALLPISPEAKKAGIKSHTSQVIGYVLAQRSDSPNGRILLVVDTVLPAKLPVDEEDLLSLSALK